MNALTFHLNTPMSDRVSFILESSGLIRKCSPWANLPGFQKDCFYPDGTPVNPCDDVIYPAYLHHLIKLPMPEQRENIPPLFSRNAADAALSWLDKVSGNSQRVQWSHNGLQFTCNVLGVPLNICFPDTMFRMSNGFQTELYAVLAVADTAELDDDWSNGTIPQYVTAQAQFILWCHKQYAKQNPSFEPAQQIRIVRIKGNLSADNTIRTEFFDYGVAMRYVTKLAKAVGALQSNGEQGRNYTLIPKESWFEKKKNKAELAYRTEDAELYALIRRYMAARSTRKQLEEQAEVLTNEIQSTAVQIAAMTKPDSVSGQIEHNGHTYTVMHNPKSNKAPTISADMLLQFFPQYRDVINTSVTEGGEITIEAFIE